MTTSEVIIYGDMEKAMQDAIEKSIYEACIDVVGEAVSLAPSDTGRLKQSITFKTPEKGGDLNVSVKKGEGYVGTPILYGIYQEFGTRYMAPQPFLRPAIAKVIYQQNFQSVIAKIVKEKANGTLKSGKKRVKFF